MKTIAGILKVIKGTIAFGGEPVTHYDLLAMARRGVGYVPQGRGIFARLTVAENLCVGETVGGSAARNGHYERVYDWFPRLKERRSQRAGTSSGGEQQMLAIGRVMVGHPTMLLLDEPSEGIQPNVVEQIAEVIMEQNARVGLERSSSSRTSTSCGLRRVDASSWTKEPLSPACRAKSSAIPRSPAAISRFRFLHLM